MSNPHVDELRRLPLPERLEAIEELWDSLEDESQLFALSDEERNALDRRAAEDEADPGNGTSWPELRRRLESDDAGA
jgi:putative addiction module component (TIGR02574 family)